MTFTEEEKKGFQDREKAREFRIALEQDMNVREWRSYDLRGSHACQSAHMLTLRGFPFQQFAQEGLTGYLKGSLASKPGLAEKSTHCVSSYVADSDPSQFFPTSASPAAVSLLHPAICRLYARTT